LKAENLREADEAGAPEASSDEGPAADNDEGEQA
jgi:hypothetical protein